MSLNCKLFNSSLVILKSHMLELSHILLLWWLVTEMLNHSKDIIENLEPT